MPWQATYTTWSSVAENIQQQSENVIGNIAGEMQTNMVELQSVAGSVIFAKGALSGDASALLNLRNQLNALLVQGQILTVHPYQYGVGNHESNGVFLSAQNAINKLIEKIEDKADDNRPTQNVNVLCVLIAANTHQDFSKVLNRFVQVLPVPELSALARRVEAELSVIDKMNTPAVDVVPRFKPNGYFNQEPLRTALKYQGAQMAQLESLASDQNDVVAKLQALSEKRNTALAAWKAAIDDLKNSNEKVQVFTASGNASSIASQLSASVVPNAQAAISTVVMFSSVEPLQFLEGLFDV